MLLATRQKTGGVFALTRANLPVKMHERADDGVAKVLTRDMRLMMARRDFVSGYVGVHSLQAHASRAA